MVLSARSLILSASALLLAAMTSDTASASSIGNMGVCYDPFHLDSYPLNGGDMDVAAFTADVEADFEAMAKYFTNVRTYYSIYYSVEIAPIAAKYGLKLDLGVYMTTENWMSAQISAAANAVQNYSSTIDTVLVGNENLYLGWNASTIVGFVNKIKNQACGGDDSCNGIKFGTVQRITEYVSDSYTDEIVTLAENLDILGVNLYPNMVDSYNGSEPTAILDTQWEQVTTAVGDASKVRLTEVGFPTAGDDVPSTAADSAATLAHAVNYYKAVLNWTPPSGDESFPKFWFSMHDRRTDDYTQSAEYEHHFGFFTHDGQAKTDDYPYLMSGSSSSTTSVSSTSASSTTSSSVTASSSATTASSSTTNTGSSATTSSSTNTSSTSTTTNSSESNEATTSSGSASTNNGSTLVTTEGSSGSATTSVGTPVSVTGSTGNSTTTTSTTTSTGSMTSNSAQGSNTGSSSTTATTTISTGSVNSAAGSGKKLCVDTAENIL